MQPHGDVYVMTAVPAVEAVTTPLVVMLAIVGLPLCHVPPVVASFSVAVAPGHRAAVPVMAAGMGSTFSK